MKILIKLNYVIGRIFNILGYIPFISIVSGLLRALVFAQIQLWIGIALKIVGIVLGLISHAVRATPVTQQLRRLAQVGTYLALEGALHASRGFIEVIPLLGNGLCLWYDFMMKGSSLSTSPSV